MRAFCRTQIVSEFKGSSCQTAVIRAVFSPDGRYVMSGSEDGRVYAWDSSSAERVALPLGHLGYNAPLCDVSWHPTQHVIAFTCYGGDHPALIYHANRPKHPEMLVDTRLGATATATGQPNAAADDPAQRAARKARLKELQAKRKRLLAARDRDAKTEIY